MKAPLDMAMAEWRRQISMKHDDGGDDEGDGDDVLVAIFAIPPSAGELSLRSPSGLIHDVVRRRR